MKYYEIGETFEFEGHQLMTMKCYGVEREATNDCINRCFLSNSGKCNKFACGKSERDDNENVYYEEVKTRSEANYIEPKDLMIYDYVYRDGYGIAKVFEVRTTSILVQLVSDGSIATWAHSIEPVRITSERLNKFGFNREGGASYWNNETFNAVIIHWNTNKNELIIGRRHKGGIMNINVIYVHEIQHAFRNCGLKELANNFKI